MATLSPEEIAKRLVWLAEAEIVYHKLNLGQNAEFRNYAGRTLKYTPANKGDLKSYMEDLRAEIAAASGSGKRRFHRIEQTGTGY